MWTTNDQEWIQVNVLGTSCKRQVNFCYFGKIMQQQLLLILQVCIVIICLKMFFSFLTNILCRVPRAGLKSLKNVLYAIMTFKTS
jgi:hypothetical protein